MVSTSDSFCDTGFGKVPYIVIKDLKVRNLETFAENCLELKPYLRFEIGNKINKTKSMIYNRKAAWNTNIEIPCLGFDPLVVKLMDRDDFDSDILLGGVSIPIEILKKITKEKEWNIKIVTDTDSIVNYTEDMDSDSSNKVDPIISFIICYFGTESLQQLTGTIIAVENVESLAGNYTEYILEVTRKDGLSWNTKFRYSQIKDIRDKMVKVFPELKKVAFPSKTYFSWLGKSQSKLNQKIIQQRKNTIELFLAHLLKYRYQEKFKELKTFIGMVNMSYH
jgi:PX domain/C2 domain